MKKAGHRRFLEPDLLIATHNEGKLRELADLLREYPVRCRSSSELGLAEPEETGTTFLANAQLKAEAAVAESGLPVLADDSGLVVAALDGDPGIHSARWAGHPRDFQQAMTRVWQALEARADHPAGTNAYFIAVLVLAWPDGHQEHFEGRVDGRLVWPPRGTGGFGYDPMFQPADFDQTFGEMSTADKRHISHRSRALRQLLMACFG